MVVSLKSNENLGCEVEQVIDLFKRYSENIESDPKVHMLVQKTHDSKSHAYFSQQ